MHSWKLYLNYKVRQPNIDQGAFFAHQRKAPMFPIPSYCNHYTSHVMNGSRCHFATNSENPLQLPCVQMVSVSIISNRALLFERVTITLSDSLVWGNRASQKVSRFVLSINFNYKCQKRHQIYHKLYDVLVHFTIHYLQL